MKNIILSIGSILILSTPINTGCSSLPSLMASITKQVSTLSALYHSAENSMRIFYQYRFLMRDMYLIFRESKAIKSHYIKLQELRKVQFRGLFDLMIEK